MFTSAPARAIPIQSSASELVNALPCYKGVGPIRSDDGGATWNSEPSAPSLAGYSFYQIAVDPADRDHCVAATTNGLYERIPASSGYQWQQRRTGVHSSVVATSSGGVTQWFAAAWGDKVYTSMNGTTWTALGTGFPTGISRIALGVQPDNPNVLYAAVSNGGLQSVQRLDGAAGAWRSISGIPPLCNGNQADYDLAIAVDPNNANLIYLGGDYYDDPSNAYPGSIYCCVINSGSSSLSMTTTLIGTTAHADDHVLVFTPGNSNALWLGSDGGLFLNTNPSGGGPFVPMNTGLATLCASHFAQHPTEAAVMFVGLQDNGTAKYVGEEVWNEVEMSDGGYGIVNWNNPFKVMCYWDGFLYVASDGGIDFSSWTFSTSGGATMEAPVVSAPYNPSSPGDANIVAFGVYGAVQISSDFGASWPVTVAFPSPSEQPYSMVGASATRFFVGTAAGKIYRLDNTGGTWGLTELDNAAGGPLPLSGLVSDIAVDWSDSTLSSIYICFGGSGDYRHVWHFNGTAWQAASGAAGSSTALLDIEHNAIQYDRPTGNLYVGADLGLWESTDGGATWNPMANGLPDAAVFDLQLHPTQRLLRACLHGRGLWEWKLDAPIQADVELLIRDTLLDTGTGVDDDGRPDPSVPPGSTVVHYESPNIKVDVPTPLGYQTPTTSIDFLTFDAVIVDGSQGVGTISPPATVHNRVYAEVHNRGRVDATNVQVMALLANASAGLPPLPNNYTADVVTGTPITTADWTTLGFVNLSGLHAGLPQIAYFDLPSTVLPLPAKSSRPVALLSGDDFALGAGPLREYPAERRPADALRSKGGAEKPSYRSVRRRSAATLRRHGHVGDARSLWRVPQGARTDRSRDRRVDLPRNNLARASAADLSQEPKAPGRGFPARIDGDRQEVDQALHAGRQTAVLRSEISGSAAQAAAGSDGESRGPGAAGARRRPSSGHRFATDFAAGRAHGFPQDRSAAEIQDWKRMDL